MRIHWYFIYCLLIWLIASSTRLLGQHVGIGTETPTQQLDVNGGIRVGGTEIANTGTIRWNASKSDFEGFNGAAWVSLTGGKGSWGNQADYATENSATQTILQYGNLPGTELGWSLAASGNWAIAGAYRDAVPEYPTRWDAGSIRLYKRTGENWNLRWSRYDPDAATNDFFGYSVGLSSTHIVSGAPFADPNGFSDAGKVYRYTFSPSTATLETILTAADGPPDDGFGTSVALDENVVLIGAPSATNGALSRQGKVYAFEFQSGGFGPDFDYDVLDPRGRHQPG